MGIEKFIKKVCVQTAVYWGNPVPDGFGNYTYDAPVDIACRWEDKIAVINDAFGAEQVCDASVLITQDVDLHGWVCLNKTAGSLSTTEAADPKWVEGVREIIGFEKIPLFRSSTKFVRKIYLRRISL